MKMSYFVCFSLGAAFFFLLQYSCWLALTAAGIAMLFSAYRHYMTRLRGVELGNVNDVLDSPRSDQAGEELEKRDFDLRDCVEESLMLFVGRTEEDAPKMVYCIDSKVPGQINGDRKRLSQVLTNLLENSVRHTSQGEIFLGIRKLGTKRDNRIELAFKISDTGTGIPASKMGQLFKGITSQAVDGGIEKKPEGPGLVVCKKLVELMGGEISVLSQPGQGATFTFNILCNPALRPKLSPVHPGKQVTGFLQSAG